MQNREDLRAIQKINKNNCNDNVKHIFLMRVEYYRVFKAQKLTHVGFIYRCNGVNF